MTLHPELRALIEGGALAHLTTINADGSPQSSVVWVGVDGDDLVSGHLGTYKKLRNLRRDPRYTISLEAPRVSGQTMTPYAVLHGEATVEQDAPAGDLLHRLNAVYVGPDSTFPAPADASGFIVRYRVDRVSGVGPWA